MNTILTGIVTIYTLKYILEYVHYIRFDFLKDQTGQIVARNQYIARLSAQNLQIVRLATRKVGQLQLANSQLTGSLNLNSNF